MGAADAAAGMAGAGLADAEPEMPWMSGGGGSACFVAGTPVEMADGSTKPIEQVRTGDTVVSRDEHTGKTEMKLVTHTVVLTARQLVTITLEDPKTHQAVDSITATPEHPFYIQDKGFVPAGQMCIGSAIATQAGPLLKVKSREWHYSPKGYTVYNLEVADDHTYFVGKAIRGMWVHNYPCPPDYRSTFFKANPGLNPNEIHVHHAIEQQVQDLYPGLFNYNEIHAAENLRGIPNAINPWAHLSAIRKAWNAFYKVNPNATRQDIIDFAGEIDRVWGGNFVPYR